MNILYIANVRMPTERAYGLQIMKTCEALAHRGYVVELAIPTRKNSIEEDAFSYYRIERAFTITAVRAPDLVRFGSIGFLISAIWFSERVRCMRSFWKADVIYSRDSLILLQYLLLRRPFAFEAHAGPSFISRLVARHARHVFVISQGLASAYAAAGIPADRITVVPDAVDERLFESAPDRSEARQSLGLPAEKHIVLYAGHLYARKGAGTLAQAAAGVPDALFVFVGGTPEDIAALSRTWGSAPNIKIAGRVKHERIPAYLRSADLLVLPNSGKDEDSSRFTSPMKLFEYMASGTPIVSSDVPAIREVLDDSMAAFVTPDDPTALGAAIKAELKDPERAQARAERALTAVRKHSWSARAEAIGSGLDEALGYTG